MRIFKFFCLSMTIACSGITTGCGNNAKANVVENSGNEMQTVAISFSSDQDVTQFRGPNRDGIYSAESGLLKQWPEGGPQLIWENSDLVQGYSSPAVLSGTVYITGMNEDKIGDNTLFWSKHGSVHEGVILCQCPDLLDLGSPFFSFCVHTVFLSVTVL